MEIDIFIDEEKQKGYLGFLVCVNTPMIQQMLFDARCAEGNYNAELKFTKLTNTSIKVALHWVNIFFDSQFLGFYTVKWDKTLESKKQVIQRFTKRMAAYFDYYDMVVFMDFDTNHKNIKLETEIKSTEEVARCYNLHSNSFDMLQLADLLLSVGVNLASMNSPLIDHVACRDALKKGEYLSKSMLKSFLLSYSFKLNARFSKLNKIFDSN